MQNLNASDGYKLYKELHNIRTERRKIKNEMQTLKILNNNIVIKNNGVLNKSYQRIVKEDELLNNLAENKVYNLRSKQEKTEDQKSLEQGKPDLKIVTNNNLNNIQESQSNTMRFKKSNMKITSWIPIGDGSEFIYARFADGKDNLVRIKDVINFDKIKK